MDRVRWLLITSGGLGLSPVAPGTVGTFGGVAVALLVQWLVPDYAVLAWSAVALLLFWWGCGQSEYVARTWPKKDPGAFVLDEVVGHLVTLITFVLLARIGALSAGGVLPAGLSEKLHHAALDSGLYATNMPTSVGGPGFTALQQVLVQEQPLVQEQVLLLLSLWLPYLKIGN